MRTVCSEPRPPGRRGPRTLWTTPATEGTTMARSKDLFDETTMSFGEHLEVLRIHLWKAIIGLVICVTIALFFGNYIIDVVRSPIDEALARWSAKAGVTFEVEEDVSGERGLLDFLREFFAEKKKQPQETKGPEEPDETLADPTTIRIEMKAVDVANVLHEVDPEKFASSPVEDDDRKISLAVSAPEFAQLQQLAEKQGELTTVTLNVQEAFLTYLKVSFVTGFVLASPWVFYQMWLFVAAGLYPHERRYVHIYLPMSIVLFVGGAVFCFYMVFPFVLDFLLGFNMMMKVTPQIRLSEWISFAIMLPVMFGISFQLPLVMLFMERISIFEAKDYREKRRMAILTISIISMLMTPADPMSMIMMMLPLLCLYELGILMCGFTVGSKSPFDEEQP